MPPSKKFILLEGSTFNRLTVIKQTLTLKSKRRYLCRCSCGKETIVAGSALKSGKTKSCGCSKKCSREHKYGSGFVAAIAAYRASKNAKERGWFLSEDDFMAITQKPCHYCGAPPAQISIKSGSNGRYFVYNGIDRVENEKGYSMDNVVPCCAQCNMAKRRLTVSEFLDLMQRIYAHHRA